MFNAHHKSLCILVLKGNPDSVKLVSADQALEKLGVKI